MIYGKLSEFGVTEDCRALDGKVLKLNRLSIMFERSKQNSLIAMQSTTDLLLEGLLFTQNFMGCQLLIYLITVNIFFGF